MKEKLLVTSFYDRAIVEAALAPLRPAVDVVFASTGRTVDRAMLIAHLQDASIVVAAEEAYDREILRQARKLRLIARDGAGVNGIDLSAASTFGVAVTNAPVVHESVADLAVGLAVAARRGILRGDTAMRTGRWTERSRFVGDDLFQAELGIIGFGRLGQAVARRFSGFGMPIKTYNRTPKQDAADALGVTQVPLDDLLADSDIVVLAVALTDETYHLMNAARFAMMKPGSTLVNVSRGGVVDEDALLTALNRGAPATAGLDVMTNEPPPQNHPFLSMDSVVLTPHIGSDTRSTFRRVMETVRDDIKAFLAGERPLHCLNPEVIERERSYRRCV